MGRAGWLTNTRGKGGGLELAVAADEIFIGDVVRETEGAPVLAECFEEVNTCNITADCRLKDVLTESAKAFYDVLDRYTIADIVKNRQRLAKVLFYDKDRVRRA